MGGGEKAENEVDEAKRQKGHGEEEGDEEGEKGGEGKEIPKSAFHFSSHLFCLPHLSFHLSGQTIYRRY